MVHRTMMIDVYLWWCTVSGAGPLFPGHKTVGVQSGCCVRCGEGEAEEKRWVMRGRVEGASTVGGDGYGTEERERERESQRYQGVGIVYRANQNQPFQRTTLSPYLSSPPAT